MLKTSLALSSFQDPHHKGAWKRAMIDAELASKIVIKTAPRDKTAPRGNTSGAPAGVTGSHAYTTAE